MTNSSGELIEMTKTFRFGSGQILTLTEEQIEKIPYLTALVSSGDNFTSARDNDGYYTLDPHIEYEHFSFVLKSLSFHSIRQLFTHLPKQNDTIAIIALLDFLSILSQPDPTLKEVDSTFFSTLVYSPMLKTHLQTIRPSIIQDMAVQLAIAMVREEYDYTNRTVIDQIYWFIMFILSANKFFGPRLRHHVYQTAEHYFSIFQPSLLKPLNKVKRRMQGEARKVICDDMDKFILLNNDIDVAPNEENTRPSDEIFHPRTRIKYSWLTLDLPPDLEDRQKLLRHREYTSRRWSWHPKASTEDELLEPVYKRVLEIMYWRLHSEVCYRARAVQNGTDARILHDIFEDKPVQEEIRERISEELNIFKPKLEKRHTKLVEEIRQTERRLESLHEYYASLHLLLYGFPTFEDIQEEALACELLLDKLHQGSVIVEKLCHRVLMSLYEIAHERLQIWRSTQQVIHQLHEQLSFPLPENVFLITLKIKLKSHPFPANKPLPKRQLKHSAR